MATKNVNIRVNTRKEKKALELLCIALDVIGLSLEDFKRYKDIAEENRVLVNENQKLATELKKRNEGANSTKDIDIIGYLTKKEEVK